MSEINNIKTTNQTLVETARHIDAKGAHQGVSASQQANPTGKEDTVSLTDTAARLHKAQQNLTKAPDIDVERIKAIKAAIAEGSYHIDDKEIAKNMVRIERELA